MGSHEFMTPHVGHFVVVLLSWQRVGGGVSGQDDLSHTRGRRRRYGDKHCTPRQKQGEYRERSHNITMLEEIRFK